MSDKLPELIDPLMLAERRAEWVGAIEIAAMPRLSESVADSGGMVEVNVRFGKEGKFPVVVGSINASLELECQNCLQAMQWPVSLDFKLAVVTSLQQAEQMEIDAEPLLFNGERMSFNALIEDEILLSLPDYPRHEHDCIQRRQSQDRDYDQQHTQAEVANPFSVLAKLKKTGE